MTGSANAGSDVTVTLRCNNRCLFCPRTTLRHVALDHPGQLRERLAELRLRSDRIILTGGEVTVLDEAEELIGLCRSQGFGEVALITNGRRLADPALAERLVGAGLTEICVTVYDLRAEVHDGLTRTAGSLAETLAGLDNVLRLARTEGVAGRREGLTVRVNTVLCAANADGLPSLVRQLSRRGVRGFLVADAVLSPGFADPLPPDRIRGIAARVARETRAEVVWRGFPPCTWGDRPPPHTEPQRIETADADEGRLEAYLGEFSGNFAQVDACRRCAVRGTCPGPQRLTVACLGEDAVRPLRAVPAVVDASAGRGRDGLEAFEAPRDPGRLAVTPTLACQMRCTYCGVELGGRHAPPEVLDRSVDLLLTSAREILALQFFGGEPLLRRAEVLRTLERAERLAADRGKRIRFTLTTNGLLLDEEVLEQLAGHDLRVLFSIDGDAGVMAQQRPLLSADPDAPAAVERNLRRLIRSGLPYFVNLVVTPDGVADLPRRVRHLADLGATRFQLCYATGPSWGRADQEGFCEALARCAELAREVRRGGGQLTVQNLRSGAEPTILSNDLLVDVDGTLYGDAAIFAEGALPGLRDAYRIGSVFELPSFDGLRRSRRENLEILRRVYPPGSPVRRRVEEHLELGRRVQGVVDRIRMQGGNASGEGTEGAQRPGTVRDRNPLRQRLLGGSLADQHRWMIRRPDILRLPLLPLENPCVHDCIFCLKKNLEPTGLDGVLSWLAANRELGLERLGLVGNEPLAHPDIDGIVDAARGAGFVRLEALTSAAPLAPEGRLDALVDAGVRGFAIPLFAADAETHDGITRAPGSFRGTLEVIERLRERGADVHVHANVLKQNLLRLDDLERLVTGELGLPLCLIPVRPKAANLSFDRLVPRYSEMIESLHVRSLVAFPRCVSARIQGEAVPDTRMISDLLKVYVLDQPFLKPPRCRECGWRDGCPGTFAAYLELHGDGELRPLP